MSSRNAVCTMLISLCLFAVVPANGQTGIQPQSTANKTVTASPEAAADDTQKQILNELREIRMLLERQQGQPQAAAPPAAEKATVSNTGYSLGSKDAPLTMVEFADYQCPFCKMFQSSVFTRLKKEYIDTGKVRFISRDLPLDMHTNALGAAQAARCAGEQDRFWQMRDLLMAHADNLAPAAITTHASQLGLDMQHFQSCIAEGRYIPAINADLAEANTAGILSTPTFVIGRSGGSSLEGTKVAGAESFASFAKILNDYSSQQEARK